MEVSSVSSGRRGWGGLDTRHPFLSTIKRKPPEVCSGGVSARLQARHAPSSPGEGPLPATPTHPVAFGAEQALGTQGHNSDPNCREAEARSSPGGQLSCERGGGRFRLGGGGGGGPGEWGGAGREQSPDRAGFAVIAAGPGQGPEGLPWGSAFEALGIASSGITVPGRSESPGTQRTSKRKRSPCLFGKAAFMSFNARTSRRETCEARTTIKTSAHRVPHFETEIKRPRST